MPTPTTVNIPDYDDRALAQLPGYQQEATNWGKLLRAMMSEAQSMEDALDQLENERHLTVAVGAQLDEIGTILNLEREGRSDDAYRYALQGQAGALAGSGEGDLLIDGYLFLMQANSVSYIEHQPATVELFAFVDLDSFSASDDAAIIAAMEKIKAAGIQIILIAVEDVAAEGLAFIWGDAADADANGDLPADADHGWGDAADADGDGNITPGLGQGGNLGRVLT